MPLQQDCPFRSSDDLVEIFYSRRGVIRILILVSIILPIVFAGTYFAIKEGDPERILVCTIASAMFLGGTIVSVWSLAKRWNDKLPHLRLSRDGVEFCQYGFALRWSDFRAIGATTLSRIPILVFHIQPEAQSQIVRRGRRVPFDAVSVFRSAIWVHLRSIRMSRRDLITAIERLGDCQVR